MQGSLAHAIRLTERKMKGSVSHVILAYGSTVQGSLAHAITLGERKMKGSMSHVIMAMDQQCRVV